VLAWLSLGQGCGEDVIAWVVRVGTWHADAVVRCSVLLGLLLVVVGCQAGGVDSCDYLGEFDDEMRIESGVGKVLVCHSCRDARGEGVMNLHGQRFGCFGWCILDYQAGGWERSMGWLGA